MRHLRRLLAMAGTVLFCQGAWALGLDTPIVLSHLNEPVQARIPLRDTKGMRASEIKVSLPEDRVFQAAGIARTAAVDSLAPQVVENGHRLYIVLTGTRTQHEPYLELLLDVAWPGGQLQRQVTLLLDPPGFHSDASTPLSRPDAAEPDVAPGREPAMRPVERRAQPHTKASGGASGPAADEARIVAEEMKTFKQRLDDLTLRLDKLSEDNGDSDAILALQANLGEMKQGQRRLEDQLHELARHQQALNETLAQQLKSRASVNASLTALTSNESKPTHGLWRRAVPWLSPTMLFAAGGLLVIAGLLLMVRHKRGKSEDEGALIDFDSDDEQVREKASEVSSHLSSSEPSADAWQQTTDQSADDAANPAGARLGAAAAATDASAAPRRAPSADGHEDYLDDDDVDIFIAHGRLEQARELLEGELKRIPDRPGTRLKLMEVLGRLGQLEALEGHGTYLATHADDTVKAHALALLHTYAAANDAADTVPSRTLQAPSGPVPSAAEFSLSAAAVPVDHDAEALAVQRHEDVPTHELSFSLDFAAPTSKMTVGEEKMPEFEQAASASIDGDSSLFSAGWSLEEVAFEAFDRDNGRPVEEPAHDERLIRAHVLLDAGDVDAASLLLRQILDEGPDTSREAARTLIERFELHTD